MDAYEPMFGTNIGEIAIIILCMDKKLELGMNEYPIKYNKSI